jgi:hypothetical protein
MTLDIPRYEDMRPHVDTRHCGSCRKKLEPGDRVTFAHIFQNAALDPRNALVPGAMLSEEYELVHINCFDPRLVKGVKS